LRDRLYLNSRSVLALSGKFPYFHRAGAARGVLVPLITGIAIVLFSTAGIARIMGWGANPTDASGDGLAPDQMPAVETMSEARVFARCAECGVIVSMRKIERHKEDPGPGAAGSGAAGNRDESRLTAARNYEFTVRMADGSSRVIEAANAAAWRRGERLIVIAGAIPSHQ
jgi:hypothetical protein